MLNTTLSCIIAHERLASLHAEAELHRMRRAAVRRAPAAQGPTPEIARAMGGAVPRATRVAPRAAA